MRRRGCVRQRDTRPNYRRAEWGYRSIAFYRSLAGDSEDTKSLVDLLADLRHWADLVGIDYADCDRRADSWFDFEADDY